MDPSVRWEYCNVPRCFPTLTVGSVDTTSNDVSSQNNSAVIIGVAVVIPVLIILIVIVIIIIFILRKFSNKSEQNKYPFKSPSYNREDKDEEICINQYYDPTSFNVNKGKYFIH